MDYNTNHPEKRSGEVWITNTDRAGFEQISFKTKRPGVVAYSPTGENLFSERFFPVFVLKSELKTTRKE
jgi:hypothetical protein